MPNDKLTSDFMSGPLQNSIPSWLQIPSRSRINPPVESRIQDLPFEELAWEDFERLCLRLVRLDADVEHCQLYGERGQDQQGIDIYARKALKGKYQVYQCKRVIDFGPRKISDAVSEFLKGEWASKSDTFVLCTSESLTRKERADTIESQSERLNRKGIRLLTWDKQELSAKLKQLPEIVDDFFGRAWLTAFCGQQQASLLDNKLDAAAVIEFRNRLSPFYKNLFNTHDPGLPLMSHFMAEILPLHERYVLPDLYDRRPASILGSAQDAEVQPFPEGSAATQRNPAEVEPQAGKPKQPAAELSQRQSIESWLYAESHAIIIGDPGSGKSSLLRFVAVDLLEESPRLSLLAQKWGRYLPIWVPFALWTRMITNSPDHTCSLKELLHGWLKSWDEEGLWNLVSPALDDKRLLLLIDGLDEWTNEQAARIAVDLLWVFIEQRDIPVIITSRPQGLNRLGIQATGWSVGELCDFSSAQQRSLARSWFAFKAKNVLKDQTAAEVELNRKADVETDQFFLELQRSPDLRELAKIPLLLCLLIYHKYHDTRLPRTRFKAYQSLVEHIISTHPQKRRTAALIGNNPDELTDDEIKETLAYLAYIIHEQFGEGMTSPDQARSFIEDYLKNDNAGFGFNPRQARVLSREVLRISEDVIGLLVKSSPQEIGFLHRAFQEYLAAFHLSGMPLVKQLSIVETYCGDPQWREVILGLLHFTSRAEDIKRFVEVIRGKSAGSIERQFIELLLCEAAFGDFNCPVNLAKELAEEAFQRVEIGAWMPHRERVLYYVLEGLRSTKVRDLVKAKLRGWFPCRIQYRGELYSAIAGWPYPSEVFDCLWRGIHDEYGHNQRAAGRAFSTWGAGDPRMGDRIATLASTAIDSGTRASAIESLLEGWPDHDDIEHIVESAESSLNPELRLMAIYAKIRQHSHTQRDYKELIRLASPWSILNHAWRDIIPYSLIVGWPESVEVKTCCMNSMRREGDELIDEEIAYKVLIEGYPLDKEVAEFFIARLRRSEYPFFTGVHLDIFSLLRQSFHNHQPLVTAIDFALTKLSSHSRNIAKAALIGCTQKAKSTLLSLLELRGPYYFAESLIEGWGMQDPEVAERMTELAFGPSPDASVIGHLLPKIIADKVECRQRLLELLSDPDIENPKSVIKGLTALGNTQGDTEVVDIILASENELWRSAISELISGYSSDRRVKEMTKNILAQTRPMNLDSHFFATVAIAYWQDDWLRQKVLEVASPLPAYLRGVIAKQMGSGTSDESLAASVLEAYSQEEDEQVRAQTAISYHTILKISGRDVGPEIRFLSDEISAIGPDFGKRRATAFCGLVTLNRLDIMQDLREVSQQDLPLYVPVERASRIPLVQTILGNWDYIKQTLGAEFWSHFIRGISYDRSRLWDIFLPFADEYQSVRHEMIQFLQEFSSLSAKPNALRFLSKVIPKNPLLLEFCLKAIIEYDGINSINESLLVVAEILGKHFGSNKGVLAQLMSSLNKKSDLEKLLIILCEAWPESDEFNNLCQKAVDPALDLSYTTRFHLLCRRGSSELVLKELLNLLSSYSLDSDYTLGPGRVPKFIAPPILRRIRSDDSLLGRLSEHLRNNPTASEKATIPKLMATAQIGSPVILGWCVNEVNNQLSGRKPPEIGFDLLADDLRPVVYSLMDVLLPA